RPAGAIDRPSFEHPDAVTKVGRELELFAFDRAPQSILQLAQNRRALQRLRDGRMVGPPDVTMMPMHAPQQLADTALEVAITARTAPTTGRAKIRHRRVAEGATHGLRAGRRNLLMHLMQKLAKRMLRLGHRRLDSPFS